ncbi:hypothetical protein [Dokdonella soli]|uniref:hypothetical protein n=1 Tax=Dokdonella soli TaxID=529810 RepID=UPI0036140C2C
MSTETEMRLHVYQGGDQWGGTLRRDGVPRFAIGGCATRDEVIAYMQANAGEPFDVYDDPLEDWITRGVDGLNRLSLRDDGEPLTGEPDIDDDNTHPGNDNAVGN